ncbi:hypothetical protein A3F66_04935 [candidate division TM6 bacterium RIFCSPHIGHO2_12_FULL_32_22]|nr:MAG: hypothetical protein A3F66_04935 [candidate division TM6 bacterium RIFCSPHIGHO2_12_FULL_32_22]
MNKIVCLLFLLGINLITASDYRAGGEAGPAEETSDVNYSNLLYGIATDIGRRYDHMEDAYALFLNPEYGLFTLFDGHGGAEVAKFAADDLGPNILAYLNHNPEDKRQAIFDAYITTNNDLPDNIGYKKGATALTALFYDDNLIVANVGDSRAVLSRNGKAYEMSVDQNPEREDEKARIEATGSTVQFVREYIMDKSGKVKLDYWLAGNPGGHRLNMSRSLGDKQFPFVIPDPEFRAIKLNKDDDFLILACDGIWDYMEESQEAVDIVKISLTSGKTLKQAAQDLIEHVKNKAAVPSHLDNMTVIIVGLNSPLDQIQKVINERAKKIAEEKLMLERLLFELKHSSIDSGPGARLSYKRGSDEGYDSFEEGRSERRIKTN